MTRRSGVGPYLVYCQGRTPWTAAYRKHMSSHRVYRLAVARADRGRLTEDPPLADAIALLAHMLGAIVIRVEPSRHQLPPEYEWVVIDERDGKCLYATMSD